ncbi:MAG: 16S rRNA (cytosine(1402)-N(4))-methyltransferase RsmH [Firmicutes bacterium]|nr:16S rRNA (cytosine(1402)-N(4))-methyltransferase RsmH [Bacillota bacterium]
MTEQVYHIPVLAQQVLDVLQPAPGKLFLDGTVGGGGHSSLLLAASAPDGFLLGLDQDDEALAEATRRLAPYQGRYRLIRSNFADMAAAAAEAGLSGFDGILLDIGVSSHQLDAPERGFSFHNDAPLDMRMDRRMPLSAADVVNTYSEDELTDIFYRYGEENWSRRIAKFIVEQREKKPLATTLELAELIKRAIPAAKREKDQHPAKRVFQALRIEVNQELSVLTKGMEAALQLLKPGGRLAVISFHSLEDRIVKEMFRDWATGCICPPKQPICTCKHQAQVKVLTRKPLLATPQELEENYRAHSAKLRAVEKL